MLYYKGNMKYLNAFRPIIEAKYGKLNKLAEENGFYIESVKYGGYEVGLTIMPVSAAPPKMCFLIVYNSEEHKRKCGSSF